MWLYYFLRENDVILCLRVSECWLNTEKQPENNSGTQIWSTIKGKESQKHAAFEVCPSSPSWESQPCAYGNDILISSSLVERDRKEFPAEGNEKPMALRFFLRSPEKKVEKLIHDDGLWAQMTWIWIPAWTLTSCATK